ncbi:hypothetical protein CRYUN_Cryun15aG0113100 [Craigia yunnanensis]
MPVLHINVQYSMLLTTSLSLGTPKNRSTFCYPAAHVKEKISGIVDSPNAVATLAIPAAIFDQDIRPKTGKVPVGPWLVRKPDVLRCTYDGNLPTTKNPAALM